MVTLKFNVLNGRHRLGYSRGTPGYAVATTNVGPYRASMTYQELEPGNSYTVTLIFEDLVGTIEKIKIMGFHTLDSNAIPQGGSFEISIK